MRESTLTCDMLHTWLGYLVASQVVAGCILSSPHQAPSLPLSHDLSSSPKSLCCFQHSSCLSSTTPITFSICQKLPGYLQVLLNPRSGLWLYKHLSPCFQHTAGPMDFKDIPLKWGLLCPLHSFHKHVRAFWRQLTFPPHPWGVRVGCFCSFTTPCLHQLRFPSK